MLTDWSSIIVSSLQDLGRGAASFVPKFIFALIVFAVGWIIAVWVGKLVAEILKRVGFDKLFDKTKWEEAMAKADFKMQMSAFVGSLAKWTLGIVFLLATVEILGMTQFAVFLRSIVSWLPNLIVAAAIFLVAVVASDFLEKFLKAMMGKMNVKYANFIGALVRWSIWVFATLAALSQLGVASDIVQIMVSGFVALIVISAGLAFGIGGKDVAKEILEGVRNKLKS